MSLALVLLSSLVLPPLGCGGGSGGTPDGGSPKVTPVSAAGSLDTAEIGGSGLQVLSLHAAAAPVDASGAFSTMVSDIGAQVLFVQDEAGAVRGMGISVPQATAAGVRATVEFDAESTALGLLYLTPGIIALEPADASARLSELRGFTSFAPLVAYLEAHLPTAPLSDLTSGDEEFATLFGACVNEWLANHPVAAASARGGDAEIAHPGRQEIGDGLTAQMLSDGGPVEVEIGNAAWRYVDIQRQDILEESGGSGAFAWADVASGCPYLPGRTGVMQGPAGFTWGNVFTGNVTTPTRRTDSVDLNDQSRAVYWVRGPGFLGATDEPPSSIPTTTDPLHPGALDAWGMSFVLYLAMPVIGAVSGAKDLAGSAADEIEALAGEAWESIAGNREILDKVLAVDSFRQNGTGTSPQCHAAVLDLSIAVIEVLLATTGVEALLVGMGAATGEAVLTIGPILAAATAIMGVANVACAVGSWNNLHWCTRFEVREPELGVVLTATPTSAPPDGTTQVAIHVQVRKYGPDQTRGEGVPTGDPVEGARVELSSTLGSFVETGSSWADGVTGDDSTVNSYIAHLVSTEQGTANVSATATDQSVVEHIEVTFGTAAFEVSPSFAEGVYTQSEAALAEGAPTMLDPRFTPQYRILAAFVWEAVPWATHYGTLLTGGSGPRRLVEMPNPDHSFYLEEVAAGGAAGVGDCELYPWDAEDLGVDPAAMRGQPIARWGTWVDDEGAGAEVAGAVSGAFREHYGSMRMKITPYVIDE